MSLFAHELRGQLRLYTRSKELAFFTFLLPLILFVLLGSTYGDDRINGDRGAIAFDFERMNELEVYDVSDEAGVQGFRRVQATEAQHPYVEAWWPVGHGLGYEHTFTHEIVDLVRAIAGESPATPGFAEALQVQQVLAAVEQSDQDQGRRTAVEATK